jgi:hypothetical protein
MTKPMSQGFTWDTKNTVSLDDTVKGKSMPRLTRRKMIKGDHADEEYGFVKSGKRKRKSKKRRK